jgi:hypothetical protein
MWKGWNISKSEEYVSNTIHILIREVKDTHEDHAEDGNISL